MTCLFSVQLFQTLLCHFTRLLLLFFFSVLFWQVFQKITCHPQTIPGCPSPSLFLYYHGGFKRTPAIWRWKRWNHPDSCPATELLKLPDKAVRPHFDSNCQSKLALPFTINKRQRNVLPHPLSEPSDCSGAFKCIFSTPFSLRRMPVCLYLLPFFSFHILAFCLYCVACCIYLGANFAKWS